MEPPTLDQVIELGMDVVSGSGAPSPAAAGRLGTAWEIAAFGLAGTLAAKEAATKVIGGRPPGSSLRDVALDVDAGDLPRTGAAMAVLHDLGVEPATVRPWRFAVSPGLRPVVTGAGGCPSGHGMVGTIPGGHLIALCFGRAAVTA